MMKPKSLNDAKHEAKLEEWREVVRECRNSGLPVNQWCKEKRINRKTYYRWQKQVWEAEWEHREILPTKTPDVKFAEVPKIMIEPKAAESSIAVQKDGWRIELQNSASPEMVSLIIEMVARYV